jgi:SAM-dependent methyltransferase
MVRRARQYNRYGRRCRFVVNRAPDLRQFRDGSLDFVHSCIVLQHMPPAMALAYVGEFFRVCSPTGVVVFQVPAALRPAELSAGALALAPAGYRAEIVLAAELPVFQAGERREIRARVTNISPVEWHTARPTDEAGHVRLANHWLAADGSVAVRDDGRGVLSGQVGPGESLDVPMIVRAPERPGSYILELDLVQELVTWFADKGSPTLRVPVEVAPARTGERQAESALPVPPGDTAGARRRTAVAWPPAAGFLSRLFRRPRTAKATFPMHVIPRPDVEAAVASHGAKVVRVFEDEASGAGWVSYTYVCVKGSDTT